jgi:hypothetical protein
MKQTLSISAMALLTGMFIFSCQKEQPINVVSQNSNSVVTVKNNLLVFNTTDDYRNLVDNSSPEQMLKFTNEIKGMKNFTHYSEHSSSKNPSVLSDSTSMNDDFLQTILNKDAAVQIGNYIFKLDFIKEKVFALKVMYASQYTDLINENTTNLNISSFSFADDVLDLILNPVATKRCKETGIGSYITTTKFYMDNEGQLPVDGTLRFRRFGIYFHLFAEVQGASGVKVSIYLEPVYYHVKCGTTVGPYNVNGYGGTANYHKYNSYQGSKNLNEVYFRGRFKGKITLPNGTPFEKYSDWIQIRVNY